MNQTFMKERPIFPLVISMSLPMVISMAVNSLYNIVDSYFIAAISENAMTALSLVFPIQNLVTSIAVGFGIGVNARIAYCLGAQDIKGSERAASTGLALSFIHGAVMTAICMLIMPGFLALYTDNSNIIKLGLIYSYRAFLFIIFINVGITYEKLFQAAGRMKVSMIAMMVGFVANIVLDPLMIFGLGPFPEMGMSGAAWATGIGQTLTLITYLGFAVFRPLPFKVRLENISFKRGLIKPLYSVGIPATLNMAIPSLTISGLNGILATFSGSYVLVLGAYYKLQTFIYLSANGIIQGIRPLVSYNYGAKELDRVIKIKNVTLALTAGVMLVGLILSYAIPSQMIRLFTHSTETIDLGVTALKIISIGFIASAISVSSCGVLEALGKGLPSLVIAATRYAIILIPLAFILSRSLGAVGVFFAFPITEITTAIIAFFIYRKQQRICFEQV